MTTPKFLKGQKVIRKTGNFRHTVEGCVYVAREDCYSSGALLLNFLSGEVLPGSYDPDMFDLYEQPIIIVPAMPDPKITLDEAVSNCKELKAQIKELQSKYAENISVMTAYGVKFIEG